MASPLNAAHKNLPFPPNRTLPLKQIRHERNQAHRPIFWWLRIKFSSMLKLLCISMH